MLTLPTPHPDTPSFNDIRSALELLDARRAPSWGQMNATQMLTHCRDFHRLCLGEIRPGAAIRTLARLLGPFFLRRFLRSSPFEAPKNLRTLAEIRASEVDSEDFVARRSDLLATVDSLESIEDRHRHPLYGAMRGQDVRAIARHHLGHHLHQFSALGPTLEPGSSGPN
ncbi:MAG: hypothetical protein AAF196_00785 [Planctomycetota bacterium]